jgi:hypothetical protein
MTYIDSGFDNNLIRSGYSGDDPEQEQFDNVNIGEIITAGALPPSEIITAIVKDEQLSIKGWTSDIIFSATDSDTVAWAAGTIRLTDGKAFVIASGNTGNISALTYIYFDKGLSETALQTTTTAATAIGANKILIAVAQNVTSPKDAEFQAFGGSGGIGKLITADNIAADTITANEMAANSVTATEIDVATLDAISADMGTLTAGTIDGGTITTDEIYDKTYGFGGAFVYTHKSTNTSGNYSFEVCADHGGLLNVTLNYTPDADTTQYKWLPGYNGAGSGSYYYVYKLNSTYRIYYYAGAIHTDVNHNTLYFTAFFNSNEANGW